MAEKDSFRHEISLDSGESDLSAFLEQFPEEKAPVAPPAPKPSADIPTPASDAPLSRYEEIRRIRGVSMEKEDLSIFTDFSTVIGKIHAAQRTVEALRSAHPDAFPDRMYSTWISNLKETHMIMMKEFHALRNGLKEKKYDKRCVCTKCTQVYLVPLPDGICDECRAADTPRGGGAAE